MTAASGFWASFSILLAVVFFNMLSMSLSQRNRPPPLDFPSRPHVHPESTSPSRIKQHLDLAALHAKQGAQCLYDMACVSPRLVSAFLDAPRQALDHSLEHVTEQRLRQASEEAERGCAATVGIPMYGTAILCYESFCLLKETILAAMHACGIPLCAAEAALVSSTSTLSTKLLRKSPSFRRMCIQVKALLPESPRAQDEEISPDAHRARIQEIRTRFAHDADIRRSFGKEIEEFAGNCRLPSA